MIDNYTIVTLVNLLEKSSRSLFELSIKTKKTIDELIEDIQAINIILKKNDLEEVFIQNNKYYISQELVENSDRVYELFHYNQISFSPEDRIKIIYLYTYCKNTYLSNFHYQEILHVSRNTTLNDLKQIRKEIGAFGIELVYTRSEGYHLVGTEYDIHRCAFTFLSELSRSPIGEWAVNYIHQFLGEEPKTNQIFDLIHDYELQNDLQSIQERLINTVYLIQFMLVRYKSVQTLTDNKPPNYIEEPTIINALAETICHLLLKGHEVILNKDLAYIELLLLGCFEIVPNSSQANFFDELALSIVTEMERLSLIQFDNRDELIIGLRRHLIPAYYRIKLGFEDINDYTDIIIDQYSDLFTIVKEALKPLEKCVQRRIPENEVAYFVVHFGGYMHNYSEKLGQVRALIVCPNGISSSLILKEQLMQLFPNISFLKTHRMEAINKINQSDYDIIFSTIKLETNKPHFIVPIFLNDEEKSGLYSLVYEEVPELKFKESPIDQLINLIGRYSTINNENDLRIELSKYIYEKSLKKEGELPLLHELITQDTFQYSNRQLDWKEAFYLAAEPLLEKNYINKNYVEKMIERVEELGPFINLGKGIAIPHARPEDGVEVLSMSMLVLENPILLPEDNERPINILIVIAAVDNETHLSALSHLTNILRDEDKIHHLANATTFSDIKDVIHQGGE